MSDIPSTSSSPLIRRLRTLTDLTEGELGALEDLLSGSVRLVPADRILASEGNEPTRIHVLVEGWAARVKLLVDGRRQFPLLMLPGDVCDLDAMRVKRLDYASMTLTECKMAEVSVADLVHLGRRFPAIGDVFGWLTSVENAILNEALASHGRRTAREHLAHFLCELLVRLSLVGETDGNSYALPLTQEELGDVLGLTAVHINRTLQGLRTEGVIELDARRIVIGDWRALKDIGKFSSGYLHIGGMRPRIPAAAA